MQNRNQCKHQTQVTDGILHWNVHVKKTIYITTVGHNLSDTGGQKKCRKTRPGKGEECVKLGMKETAEKHCTILDKMCPRGYC